MLQNDIVKNEPPVLFVHRVLLALKNACYELRGDQIHILPAVQGITAYEEYVAVMQREGTVCYGCT